MHSYPGRRTAQLTLWLIASVVGGCAVASTPEPSHGPSPTASSSEVPRASGPSPEPSPITSPGAWTRLGDMKVPLGSLAGLELADGRVVVLDQGPNAISDLGGGPYDPIPPEVLDPATGTWTPVAALNAPRSAFVAVRLRDGRILVTGGNNGWHGAYSSTKLFDPATGGWTASGLLNTARMGPIGALLPDGRVLVAGGVYSEGFRNAEEFSKGTTWSERSLTSAEIYDPVAGRWTETGPLHHLESAGSAFSLPDGRVLAVGATCEVYDPRSAAWTEAAGCVERLPRSMTVALDDGSLLVIGGGIDWGGPALSRVLRFDPETGSSKEVAPLPVPRMGAVAVQLGDGSVLVAGGAAEFPKPPSPEPPSSATFIFDPVRNTWSPAAPMPFADLPAQAMLLSDGTVLVMGGVVPIDDRWCIDCPETEAVGWTAAFRLEIGDGR